jgi:NitT/TauT family transport system permease protein
MLIVVGTAPIMTRSLAQAVMDIPDEQIIKAETLGANGIQMVIRVVLPQIWPKLFTAIRLGLVPAWIFLISAEAIASTGGLGYRIFLVRRYLAMDVILPYVAWITLWHMPSTGYSTCFRAASSAGRTWRARAYELRRGQ